MNGRLQGFLDFLDLLAEGSRRQAELIAGRELRLQPVEVEQPHKIPLTGLQISHLFDAAPRSRVSSEH
jgi:hypothetical protein